MSLEHGVTLGIPIALLAFVAAGCGSEAEDFPLTLEPVTAGLGLFWASEVTYEIRSDSLGSVERGDFELVHWDIGPVGQRWERLTTLRPGEDYWIDVSASNDSSRCSGSAPFAVPPNRLTVLLFCDEPPELFYDFEAPEDLVLILGTVEDGKTTR